MATLELTASDNLPASPTQPDHRRRGKIVRTAAASETHFQTEIT
jgi:hypothetical protein